MVFTRPAIFVNNPAGLALNSHWFANSSIMFVYEMFLTVQSEISVTKNHYKTINGRQ